MLRCLVILTVIALAKNASAEQELREVDVTKRQVVERPTELVVQVSSPPLERSLAAEDDNPSVPPGKVNWHKDVPAAIAAAGRSGKPVLVFHLLGQLDQRFT